jgi:predicted metal-dependent HD superfamily phosphohydrolase
MSTPDIELRRVWRGLTGRSSDAHIDELLARHAEPHRRYHTAHHVMWVARHVDELLLHEPGVSDGDAVRAAALYHDVVYDPRSSSNERDSAALARRDLADIGWEPARCELVAALVEATATHEATIADAAVLLDADLSILGAQPSAYAAYVSGVRAEYAFVPEDSWRTGRASVLQAFLDRPRIYATDTMFAAREPRARANLSAELATLGRGPILN